MLILSKKRIAFMLCMLFVSLCFFSLADSAENITDLGKIVETVATPVSNKVVIVDAGHPEYFLTR